MWDLTRATEFAHGCEAAYSGMVSVSKVMRPNSIRRIQNAGVECFIVFCDDCTALIFTGSNDARDWLRNLDAGWRSFLGKGKVHRGFGEGWLKIRYQVLEALARARRMAPIYITGHSQGAALAQLAAADLPANLFPVEGVYVYGSPRVGNRKFVKSLESIPIYRHVADGDLVARYPFWLGGWRHGGNLVYLDGEVFELGDKEWVTETHIVTEDALPWSQLLSLSLFTSASKLLHRPHEINTYVKLLESVV